MAERYKPFLAEECPIKKLAKDRGLPGCGNECVAITPKSVCPHTSNSVLFEESDTSFKPTNPSNMFVANNLAQYGVDVSIELPHAFVYKNSDVDK